MEILYSTDYKLTQKYTKEAIPHKNLNWELTIFESGTSRHIVNGCVYDGVSCGDVFLVGPMHTHSIEIVSDPHSHRDVYCTDENMRRICAMFPNEFYKRICEAQNPVSFKLSPSMMSELLRQLETLEILDSIVDIHDTKQFAMKTSIANAMIHFILSLFIKEEFINEDKIPLWFYTAVHEIQKPENFVKRIDEIIRLTNYSHAQFSKIFKRYMGENLIDYVMNLRLEYAAELLRMTDKNVLEISSLSGYDSLSFFIKIFKKKFSVTPVRYRKNAELVRSTPPRLSDDLSGTKVIRSFLSGRERRRRLSSRHSPSFRYRTAREIPSRVRSALPPRGNTASP